MSDVSVLPGSLAVRNLFEDLLGREVTVSPGDPLSADEIRTATVAIFTDNSQKIYAAMGLQLSLAANAGAALGLLPPGAAEDSIDEKQLFPNLAENVGELCNIFTSLLNKEGAPHTKLYQVIYPGMELPADARAILLALGRRLDLMVEVSRYGKGKMSLSLAP
ncbi:hypothetical protein ACWT_7797 [Actinoplanes sp. SE50]|uniref:hypothetical protein n=1 Tax=unclassified Actinoplanes TaxID=2626549 RepID=UPI00023EDEFF|nr:MULTISPECIES: hypothetical protein [unclassified Actinoplanes]AEV88806.1 hypothetical protein ACPL_7928 [Actinoplanes sp. SE50/110]ATO87212.1 hypothetical protein ACWT_7797 [Actinoplanes sp. SE50]SLM04630.1 putative response regulator receiver protein [Actinoplanes sp. SE50/110]